MSDRPLNMTTRYFTIFPDDIIPVWTEWCGDGEEGGCGLCVVWCWGGGEGVNCEWCGAGEEGWVWCVQCVINCTLMYSLNLTGTYLSSRLYIYGVILPPPFHKVWTLSSVISPLLPITSSLLLSFHFSPSSCPLFPFPYKTRN